MQVQFEKAVKVIGIGLQLVIEEIIEDPDGRLLVISRWITNGKPEKSHASVLRMDYVGNYYRAYFKRGGQKHYFEEFLKCNI